MSITHIGYFADDGFWRIKAKLNYEGKTKQNILDFLIDSGSATTIISPQDADEMGIGFDTLIDARETNLYGAGACKGREILNPIGIVFFENSEVENLVEPCIKIYVPDPEIWKSGNILGLDILNRYNITTDIENNKIYLTSIKDNYMTCDV